MSAAEDGAAAPGLASFEPLAPAEARILAGLQSGQFDRIGDGLRPAGPEPGRVVRAGLLRFILLGGEPGCRPHEKGLRVIGAYITGTLDLEGCRIPRDVGLSDCAFAAPLNLRSAVIDNLFLDGSSLPGLFADRLEARGGLSLHGTAIAGKVGLRDARLGGSLEADGVAIIFADDVALEADRLDARGAVLLRGARIEGGVSLAGARIGGDLNAAGATVVRPGAVSLGGDGMTVGGDVALREARVAGTVELRSVDVSGDVDASGARLARPGGIALCLNRSVIGGVFFLRRGAAMEGALDLRETRIGAIEDDRAAWPAAGELLLNRCRYDAFIGGPVDAANRLDWLARQAPERWGEDFWPQPYEQLAEVFRAMGHDEDARAVLLAKERLHRRARRARATSPAGRALLAASDLVLGATVGFGRRPLLAFLWLLLFWAVGVGVFGLAERAGAFKPNLPFILRAPEWIACGLPVGETLYVPSLDRTLPGRREAGETPLACFRSEPEGRSYPKFQALMYSADVLLPFLDLGQSEFWRPDPARPWGEAVLFYAYLQKLFGWAFSLLAIAGFSGLVKTN